MWKRAVALGILSSVLAAALIARRWFPEPAVISGVLEADTAHLGSLVGGRVAHIFVSEGAAVDSKAPLVRFDPFDLNAKLARAVAAAEAAKADLARLKAGFRPEEKIVYVSPRAEFTPSNVQTPKERRKLVYRVKILVEDETDRLRPGMMAEIRLP